ncbi:MAG: hypothetical protein KGD65_06705 [Candidatus Lokiarchaeota archaeon]|nr:hypothetical protein [Candidatus Lokiarchaeota archaeon]
MKQTKKIDFNEFDLIFLGAPCHDTDLAKPLIRILRKLPESPKFKIAGFFTHSTTPPEGNTKNKSLYDDWAGNCSKSFEKMKQEKNAEFLGFFRCQRAPSPGIETFIHQTIIKYEDEWQDYIKGTKNHPDQNDLENAKKFAAEILQQC